ncbi:L-lactate dehydrogenase [Aeromicrobium sp. 636]|uniref:L-lactate dehydrogenase n=1 Tax=Aeromicrobium senzhongii TaxID=2663859 RepID=A0A8I0ETJ4_9ACTN|nr:MULTISPECIES: L-lactate dehydrogenase [Aeromicrobium]MBC9225132.1 L-lactate dehydrogenase [Aeromicrobium senzhongii]MCQ3997242.1 L-lactate dehydrogenase [Aeromicrobium sp. 636]MTB87174.1 L-lactate dehydrogenase [Aeromicrobium senzhongii]QNL95748.1 L-lactate dehydrogenase [Aeromicrobium senzhongii]
MAVIENSKVAVIGAGSVGTAIAYACLIRRSARTIALYDVNQAKVEAEVLDLQHGALYTGSSQIIGGADPSVVAGAHLVVITAGAKQDPGQSRIDLAGTNVRILESLLPVLMEQAPNAVYMLVTNPCDVLTVAAQQITGLPDERVMASGTVLDTSRLRQLLATRAGIAPNSVHADIVGEHGDTEFALWSQARIGPVPILDWQPSSTAPERRPFTHAELDEIADTVRNAAYKVIEGKGATNYAIGISAARIVEAILNDENAVLPVSIVHRGHHGIDGVALSLPSVVNSRGVAQVLDVRMSAQEDRHLHASAEALKKVQEDLGI